MKKKTAEAILNNPLNPPLLGGLVLQLVGAIHELPLPIFL